MKVVFKQYQFRLGKFPKDIFSIICSTFIIAIINAKIMKQNVLYQNVSGNATNSKNKLCKFYCYYCCCYLLLCNR